MEPTYFDNVTDSSFFYTESNEAKSVAFYFMPTTEELAKKFPYLEKETGRYYNHQILELSANAHSKNEVRCHSRQGNKN